MVKEQGHSFGFFWTIDMPSGTKGCSMCGALVIHEERHRLWHEAFTPPQEMARRLNDE